MQNKETFQQYVDKKYNIKNMGPYDYIEFCKKMREPEFKHKIYESYNSIFISSIKPPLITIPK
jgi:hypothetical protein